MATDHTRPNDKTREAEVRAAGAPHEPDRPPTTEEEQAAEGAGGDPATSGHAKEMLEKGAHQKGEGRIG